MPCVSQSRRTGSKARRKYIAYYFGLVLITLTIACNRLANLAPNPPKSLPPLASSSPTLTAFPQQFHVKANAFVDQNGKPMVFRGMSAIDPIYQRFDNSSSHTQWSEQYYQVMAQWCANIVRLPILPSSLRNFGMEKTLDTLDQTIAWAAENKIYVIIDFHSLGWPPDNYYPPGDPWYSTTPKEMMDFWNSISSRYANNNTVAFYELYNEPVTSASYKDNSGASTTLADWLIWKNFMDQIITGIRANDPNKIILVGGLQFAYDLSFVANAPVTGENVAYAVHPYSHPQWKKSWKTAFGDISSQYPVFATEFGYDDENSLDDIYDGNPYHQAIVDYLEGHHISWTAWNFDTNWSPRLLIDNFTYQPSSAGQYFRSMMVNLNQCR